MKTRVKLIEYTREPEKVIAAAAKLCYSSSGATDLMEGLTEEKVQKFMDMLMSLGHESPIEHVSFTFAIEGISRSCSHQIVRHRIASYSQQSQRYVKLNQFSYIIPPEVEKIPEAKELFVETMEKCQDSYDKLSETLTKKFMDMGMDKRAAEKKAIEDARYVFPNACETKMVMTMNARSLMNFFQHRCCERAQWEIRNLADLMLKEVIKVAPILFKKAGPPCVSGGCKEGKMSCQKSKEIKDKYEKIKEIALNE